VDIQGLNGECVISGKMPGYIDGLQITNGRRENQLKIKKDKFVLHITLPCQIKPKQERLPDETSADIFGRYVAKSHCVIIVDR